MLDSLSQTLVETFFLNKLRVGRLNVALPDGSVRSYGDLESPLVVDMQVNDAAAFTQMVRKDSVGLADAYMARQWETADLARFVELVVENAKAKVKLGLPGQAILIRIQGLLRRLRHNEAGRSRKNVKAHYDIGNSMYELMLDSEVMGYTCGLYRDPKRLMFDQFDGSEREITVEQAQLNKYRLLAAKAGVKPGDTVVELGCGWGGFAILLAREFGCTVKAYNLSHEQVVYARQKAEGLPIEFVEADYRTADGQYDAVVSVGMAEHVGDLHLPAFLQTVERLLKPGGTAVVHTITSADRPYDLYKLRTGFIQEYIFPGCCIPAVKAIIGAMGDHTDLELQHFENIGKHYALTLRHWRTKFYDNIEQVRALGYDEAFIRMWDFYLCNCEAEFTTGHLGLGQFVFRRPSVEPLTGGWLERHDNL